MQYKFETICDCLHIVLCYSEIGQTQYDTTGVFITTTGDPCGTNRFEIQMDGAKLVAENDTLTLWELDVAEPEFILARGRGI